MRLLWLSKLSHTKKVAKKRLGHKVFVVTNHHRIHDMALWRFMEPWIMGQLATAFSLRSRQPSTVAMATVLVSWMEMLSSVWGEDDWFDDMVFLYKSNTVFRWAEVVSIWISSHELRHEMFGGFLECHAGGSQRFRRMMNLTLGSGHAKSRCWVKIKISTADVWNTLFPAPEIRYQVTTCFDFIMVWDDRIKNPQRHILFSGIWWNVWNMHFTLIIDYYRWVWSSSCFLDSDFCGDAWHPDSHELDPATWMFFILFFWIITFFQKTKSSSKKNSTENLGALNLECLFAIWGGCYWTRSSYGCSGPLGVGFSPDVVCDPRGSSSAVYGLQMVDLKKKLFSAIFSDGGSS